MTGGYPSKRGGPPSGAHVPLVREPCSSFKVGLFVFANHVLQRPPVTEAGRERLMLGWFVLCLTRRCLECTPVEAPMEVFVHKNMLVAIKQRSKHYN